MTKRPLLSHHSTGDLQSDCYEENSRSTEIIHTAKTSAPSMQRPHTLSKANEFGTHPDRNKLVLSDRRKSSIQDVEVHGPSPSQRTAEHNEKHLPWKGSGMSTEYNSSTFGSIT